MFNILHPIIPIVQLSAVIVQLIVTKLLMLDAERTVIFVFLALNCMLS